jgi:hypothetical protein
MGHPCLDYTLGWKCNEIRASRREQYLSVQCDYKEKEAPISSQPEIAKPFNDSPDDRYAYRTRSRGSSTLRSQSPIKFAPSAVSVIARQGNATIHHDT